MCYNDNELESSKSLHRAAKQPHQLLSSVGNQNVRKRAGTSAKAWEGRGSPVEPPEYCTTQHLGPRREEIIEDNARVFNYHSRLFVIKETKGVSNG